MVALYEEARIRAAARGDQALIRSKARRSQGIDVARASATGRGTSAVFGDTRSRAVYAYFRDFTYVCVHQIAKRLAGQPWMAGEQKGARPNPERRLKYRAPRPARKDLDDELELLPEHEVLDLLKRPNPVQRKFEFLYSSVANLLLSGESYWLLGVGEAGGHELWAIPTHWIEPIHDEGLFSSYKLRLGENKQPIEIPSEIVARTYLSDPFDPRKAQSPLHAVIKAVRIDDHILTSQDQTFERGIFPNLVLTVGRVMGPDGKLSDRRPVLDGGRREQITLSLRQILSQNIRAGDPVLVDGLIESIHKIHNTPQEMDWGSSSELIRKRIMMAFSLNKFIVGDVEDVNRANAVEAEKQLASNVVNPLADCFSETATDMLGPLYERPQRLTVWIEEIEPKDPELELQRYIASSDRGITKKNEFRMNVLGLPPDEDEEERGPLMDDAQGVMAALEVLDKVGKSSLPPETAEAVFTIFYRMDEEDAKELVDNIEPKEPPPNPFGLLPPSGGNGEEEDEEEEEEKPPDGEEEDTPAAATSRQNVGKSAERRLEPRDAVKALHVRQQTDIEEGMGQILARHFPSLHNEIRGITGGGGLGPQPGGGG